MNDSGARGCRLASDGSLKSQPVALFSAVAVLLFSGVPSKADLAPGTCTPGSNGSDGVPQASSPGPYALGERMGYRVLLTNPTLDKFLNPGCTISNAVVNLRLHPSTSATCTP